MPSCRPHSSLFGTWFEGAAGGGARARSHQTGARRVRTRVTCGCASDMSPPHPPHAAQRHSVAPLQVHAAFFGLLAVAPLSGC